MRVVSLKWLMVVLHGILLTSCGPPGGEGRLVSESRVLMGTAVQISVAAESGESGRAAIARAFSEIEAVDREMSPRNPRGALARLNREGRGTERDLGEGLVALLRRALAIAGESRGAFDPTIGAVSTLWQFESGGVVPDRLEIEAQLNRVGWKSVLIDEYDGEVGIDLNGSEIDLGAMAKGHAIDLAVASLRRDGVRSAIVDAGGDLRLVGDRPGGGPWRVGVQDPRDPARLVAKLALSDVSVATSGDYERAFVHGGVSYHHILDPGTGMPARACRSVTVVAATAAEADAVATAAFVMGPGPGIEFIRSRPGVCGVVVDAKGGVLWTSECRKYQLGGME